MLKRNPLRTKTDKLKLGPLSLSQLEELKMKSLRARDKSKIQNRIKIMIKRSGVN